MSHSDNLRDRIADALFDACCRFDVPDSERWGMADAVIEALGLERENWNVDMGVSTLPRHMWVKPTPVHRYVTEWVADDE